MLLQWARACASCGPGLIQSSADALWNGDSTASCTPAAHTAAATVPATRCLRLRGEWKETCDMAHSVVGVKGRLMLRRSARRFMPHRWDSVPRACDAALGATRRLQPHCGCRAAQPGTMPWDAAMPKPPTPADPSELIERLPPDLAPLARRGVVRNYRKGVVLIEEGDMGDTIYLILVGKVKAFSSDAASEREITYGHYGPGEYVGELGLDGRPRAASVQTLERTCCAVVTRPLLEAHIAEHPAFAFTLLAKVISRARAATLSARSMALNDVYGRVKLLLEGEARRDAADGAGGAWWWLPACSHRDLAARVGCSPSMVSRVWKDLETGGHVVTTPDGLRLRLPLPPRW